MERKTIIAIVLSIVIFVGWTLISGVVFKQNFFGLFQSPQKTTESPKIETKNETPETMRSLSMLSPVEDASLTEKDVVFKTELYSVTFSTKGGVLKSLTLNKYLEKENKPVDMVLSKDTGEYPFIVKFGDYSTDKDLYSFKLNRDENKCEFSRKYKIVIDNKETFFNCTKVYSFMKDKYGFSYQIIIENETKEYLPLDFNGTMYTLSFGPQIGPDFKELTQYEFRRYLYYANGARKDFSGDIGKDKKKLVDNNAVWLAVEGKYFIALVSPPSPFVKDGEFGFDATPLKGLNAKSSMYFKRPSKKQIIIEDLYKFYVGPKKKDLLMDDVFKELYFDRAIEDDWLLGWLNEILKFSLNILHDYVKNWGIAIIILTFIIKLVFFPLSQKSYKSNQKMQALAPKLNELKEKFKDNPQKMQAETAALYKNEGINPLGGCLPLLIQIPFFVSFYNILNTYFDLRGASFITGWINDLSAPESIFTMPFAIPVLGADIRLLPFIMLATSFIQQLLSQPPGGGVAQTGNTKLLMYGMPVVFFFILYNLPSGLTLYWTMQNFFSIIQQLIINLQKKPTPVPVVTEEEQRKIKKRNTGVKK